jgi:hypothetical protein
VLGNQNPDSLHHSFTAYVTGDTLRRVQVHLESPYTSLTVDFTTAKLSKWHHVCAVFEGGTSAFMCLYALIIYTFMCKNDELLRVTRQYLPYLFFGYDPYFYLFLALTMLMTH